MRFESAMLSVLDSYKVRCKNTHSIRKEACLHDHIGTSTIALHAHTCIHTENLPRTQNFTGWVPPEAAYFSLKMTVLGELHCVVLPLESLGGTGILHVYKTLVVMCSHYLTWSIMSVAVGVELQSGGGYLHGTDGSPSTHTWRQPQDHWEVDHMTIYTPCITC